MIDFPASPNVGDIFTSGGLSWRWDGTKWVATGGSGQFLPLTAGPGSPLTGSLTIAPPSNTANLLLNKPFPSGYGSGVYGQMAGAVRWVLLLGDNTNEAGANAGSNFQIENCSDAGVVLGSALSINRASGQVTIPNLSAPGVIGDNRIINGDMRVNQRGATSGTASGYTVDRWVYNSSGVNKGTWQQTTSGTSLAIGFPYYLQFLSSSAYTVQPADGFTFNTRLEADSISDFCWGTANARPVTLSFWAAANVAGNYGGSLRNYANTRSYPFTFNIATANVFQFFTITIPGDTGGTWVMNGNAGALYLIFDLGSGSNVMGTPNAWQAGNFTTVAGCIQPAASLNGWVIFTGVKLEIGNVATPFNRQSLAKTMVDCQRYFRAWKPGLASGGIAPFIGSSTTTQGFSLHYLDAPMRAAPTISASGNFLAWQPTSSSPAVTFSSASLMTNLSWMCTWAGTGLIAGAPGILRDADGTAALLASAEL